MRIKQVGSRGFTVIEFLLIVIILGALGGVGWYVWQQNQTNENTSTATTYETNDTTTEKTSKENPYPYTGTLRDVTMAKNVRGINTGGNASGEAKARFEEGTYSLMVTVSDTPDPEGDDFYEGWIVRKSPFKFISTGKLEKNGEVYINNFSSNEDLTEFDQYVLTLEPNDSNPAPADHIVEGVLQKN